MNDVNQRNNIIGLAQHRSGSHGHTHNQPIGKLLAAVRGIGRQQLTQLIGGMFERVDDTLFDLAEKAENNALQTQYFDGMRDVRKKRPLIERSFLDMVTTTFSELASGSCQGHDEAHSDQHDFDDMRELSLINEPDLEESLAITSMSSKAEGRFAQSLFAVNQRLTVICGGNKVDNTGNPLAPAMLAHAFGEAMSELKVEVQVKLIVYKLFERYVLGNLEALYEEANHTLVQAGVLPQLRTPISRRAGPVAHGTRRAHPTSPPEDDKQDEQGSLRAQLTQTLQSLLAERRQSAAFGAAMDRGGSSLSPAELLNALSTLQSDVARNIKSMPTQFPLDTALLAEQVRLLKEQLVQHVSHLRGEAKSQVSGADEDTIDLTSMLFEYILQDHNLPMQMQVLLARLQIPYLKAAIFDRHLFTHGNHPAHLLLDQLGEAAKGWSAESDRNQHLLNKVHNVVAILLSEFDDDTDVFNRQLQDFRKFIDNTNRHARMAEQRTVEATNGREKLQQARHRVAQEIRTRIDDRQLPTLINDILTRAWANYLVLTLLRHGEDSEKFCSGLRFVDDFICSADPVRNDNERQRLCQLRPLLEQSLRHGLATVAFQDSDVETLMQQLDTLYNEQLNPHQHTPRSAAHNAAISIVESMEAITMHETNNTDELAQSNLPDGQPDSPEALCVRTMKLGTWVELQANGECPERAKLSWISPSSGKYLFVNRRGMKVADKTLKQLAAELASGETVVLEELPLFDRALDTIIERLRNTQAQPELPPRPSIS